MRKKTTKKSVTKKESNLMQSHPGNDFFNRVSHEFRTPLTAIIGYAEIILGDPQLSDETRQRFAEIIKDQGVRLSNLVDECLDYSSLKRERIMLEKEECNLIAIVDQAVTLIRPQSEAKSIRLITLYHESTLFAHIDPKRILQLFLHLLSNAVKFTPHDGGIRLEVEARDGMAEISIQDSGIGIPPEELPHLFDRFPNIAGPGRQVNGIGLGLAIAKQLIELHGGSITVRSEVNCGSTFTIRIPRG